MSLLNIIPPAKGAFIKVTSPNVVFYWETNTQSKTQDKIKPQKLNAYSKWAIGDTVQATGNTFENEQGFWIEATAFRWYKRNILAQYVPIPVTIYYRVQDSTCTWLAETITGTKPSTTPIGGTNQTENKTPDTTAKQVDNTLAYVSIAIGLFGILSRK